MILKKIINKLQAKITPDKTMTEEKLHLALLEGEKSGVVESRERTMVEGVFYLGDRPVSAFMTHRSEIKWLDINAGPEDARKTADEAGNRAYLPVADGNPDKVLGVISVQDLYRALLDESWPGLRALMKPPSFIPETMPALKAFEAFKRADASDLFAMDEYGGFAGILTVRNLIEEIVGELSASPETLQSIVKQEDGTWLSDGGVSIDDAAAELGLPGLGDEHRDYHTLAGFILFLAGEIPAEGMSFDYEGYRFKVLDLDHNRIDKILIARVA
ncbi:MAG: hemolysin family protein [Treponema sp.]|nr:hemolysin family protein [Treponema sp.]